MAPPTYTIACLCYLFDDAGRVLMLHRRKPPNAALYSPIGGKLEQHIGESPAQCAAREIGEEAGLDVAPSELHLTGLVTEAGYQGGHWMMFLYELPRAVAASELRQTEFDEGRLVWVEPGELEGLALPETDRAVIWPMFWRHRGGFFAAHLAFDEGGQMSWTLDRSELASRGQGPGGGG